MMMILRVMMMLRLMIMLMMMVVMMMIDDSSQSQQKWFDCCGKNCLKKSIASQLNVFVGKFLANSNCLNVQITFTFTGHFHFYCLTIPMTALSLKPKLQMCVSGILSAEPGWRAMTQTQAPEMGAFTPMMVSEKRSQWMCLAPVAWHMIFIHLGWKIRENTRNESIRSIAPLRKRISYLVGPQQTITIQHWRHPSENNCSIFQMWN